MANDQRIFSTFHAVGVNHWDTPIDVREKFSLSDGQQEEIIEAARGGGIDSLLVISTCNRVELVAQSVSPNDLNHLLISHSDATAKEFQAYGFQVQGKKAIEHLFEVACGLDSQILGDVQIINQMKEAYRFASAENMIESEFHRLMQHVFRAHKRARKETSLGEGAATTAYAAVQFAKNRLDHLSDKNILLIGTGKIGEVTCRNLVRQGARNVTVINRTPSRATNLAEMLGLKATRMVELPAQIAASDLIIVATDASEPVITEDEMKLATEDEQEKVLLDLSVPRNIDPKVGDLQFVDLANMDYLSEVKDEAYQRRKENIPQVKEIIETELSGYQTWLQTQKVVPTIKALTRKFEGIRKNEFSFFEHKIKHSDRDKVENLTRRIVNKIAAYSIEHLRDHHESKQLQQMVNDMFELESRADYK